MTAKFDSRAALWAGLIAGLVFMVLEMALVAAAEGGSPWGPPRMIAAIALGKDVLPPPATFDLVVFSVAMIIHFLLSVVLGIVLGLIISWARLGLLASIAAGVVFGMAVYLVDFYGFTALFPWFAMARTGITVVAHIVFGLVLGWTYHALAVRHYARAAAARDPAL